MAEITTASGLIYEDTVVGTGAEARAGDHVVVHYTGWLTNGSKFETIIPPNTDVVSRLEDSNVTISAQAPEGNPLWSVILSSWLPFLVIIGVWFFFIRQMQGGVTEAEINPGLLTSDDNTAEMLVKELSVADEVIPGTTAAGVQTTASSGTSGRSATRA